MELFFIALILLPFVAYLISKRVEKDKQKSVREREKEKKKNLNNFKDFILVILNIILIIGSGGMWILFLIALWAMERD